MPLFQSYTKQHQASLQAWAIPAANIMTSLQNVLAIDIPDKQQCAMTVIATRLIEVLGYMVWME